jgi:hypothetical protein
MVSCRFKSINTQPIVALVPFNSQSNRHTHTHTHTHIYSVMRSYCIGRDLRVRFHTISNLISTNKSDSPIDLISLDRFK